MIRHHPTFQELTKIFALMHDPGDTEAFWHFFRVYRKSDIYKIPCGYIRIEPYPRLQAATIHGIFHSNPFYYSYLIKNTLQSYMEERPWLTRLECIVPNDKKSLKHFCKLVSKDFEEFEENTVFYWR